MRRGRSVQPAPPENDVQAFIEWYVREHGVSAKYRWGVDKMNTLHEAGQTWRVHRRDSDVVLKRKIMAWVRAVDEKEEEEQRRKSMRRAKARWMMLMLLSDYNIDYYYI